jgi:RecA-family ATPase
VAAGFNIATFAGNDATLAFTGDNGMIEESPLFLRLIETIEKLRPRLVGIDNLADVFAGNEIVRTQVRQFMTKLHGLALRFNNAVVMTAHPSLGGMSSGKGTSGSTGWNNAFRSRMYFRGEQKDDPDDDIDRDYRELEVMKANYTLNGEVVKLRWRNGVFAPDQDSAEIDQSATQRAEEEQFLRQLDEFEQQGRIVSYKPKSNNYAPHMFSLGITNSKTRKHKREAYERAMERLFSQRRVRSMPYGKPSDGTTQLMRQGRPGT